MTHPLLLGFPPKCPGGWTGSNRRRCEDGLQVGALSAIAAACGEPYSTTVPVGGSIGTSYLEREREVRWPPPIWFRPAS